MAEPFLSDLRQLAGEWTRIDGSVGPIECRHFFSGAAAYRGEAIVATLTPVGLACKVSPEARGVLLSSGEAVSLRYFPNAPIKRDYVLFPEGTVEATQAAALILGYLASG